jgi:hypothetical protein
MKSPNKDLKLTKPGPIGASQLNSSVGRTVEERAQATGSADKRVHTTGGGFEMIGSFQAQHFKFLSFDPNTIFQFFVATDRLYLVKVGSALNQLPQVLHLARGPIGLSDLAAEGLPADHEVQRLVRADTANYEITFGELTDCIFSAKHWLSAQGAITLRATTRGKLFFRFLDARQATRARGCLTKALGPRMLVA